MRPGRDGGDEVHWEEVEDVPLFTRTDADWEPTPEEVRRLAEEGHRLARTAAEQWDAAARQSRAAAPRPDPPPANTAAPGAPPLLLGEGQGGEVGPKRVRSSNKNTTRTRLNAVSHGLFSPRPVLPGLESEDDWATFHRDTLARLAPADTLERELAERVALSLWRLRRVARYETGSASAALDRVPEDTAAHLLKKHRFTSREELAAHLDDARIVAAFVHKFARMPDDHPLTRDEALAMIDLALVRSPSVPRERFGLTPDELFRHRPADPRAASLPQHVPIMDIVEEWTAGAARAVCAAISFEHAHNARRPGPPQDRSALGHVTLAEQARLDARLAIGDAAVAAERVAEAERLLDAFDAEADRLRRERSLPPLEVLDKVTRYEAHLNRQYATALAQLESLQSRRRSHSPTTSRNPEITERTPTSPDSPTSDASPPPPSQQASSSSDLPSPWHGEGQGVRSHLSRRERRALQKTKNYRTNAAAPSQRSPSRRPPRTFPGPSP